MLNTEYEIVGVGSGMNPKLGNTSFLGKNGDRRFLVDCGFTVTPTLDAAGRIKEVTDIVVTHDHSDHTGGLELMGFTKMYAPEEFVGKKPNLYVATDDMAHNLWQHSLRGGMGVPETGEYKYEYTGVYRDVERPIITMDKNHKLVVYGRDIPEYGKDLFREVLGNDGKHFTLDDYFNVKVGNEFKIEGLVEGEFIPTPHVFAKENYGLELWDGDGKTYYSGDTITRPTTIDADLVLHDLQFPSFDKPGQIGANAHVTYDEFIDGEYERILDEFGGDTAARTVFVHLWKGHQKVDPSSRGFAGYALPGSIVKIVGTDPVIVPSTK